SSDGAAGRSANSDAVHVRPLQLSNVTLDQPRAPGRRSSGGGVCLRNCADAWPGLHAPSPMQDAPPHAIVPVDPPDDGAIASCESSAGMLPDVRHPASAKLITQENTVNSR